MSGPTSSRRRWRVAALGALLGAAAGWGWSTARPDARVTTAVVALPDAATTGAGAAEQAAAPDTGPPTAAGRLVTDSAGRLVPSRDALQAAVTEADYQLVVAEPPELPRDALFAEFELPEGAPAWAIRFVPEGDSAWMVAPWDGEETTGPFERVPAGRRVTYRVTRFRLAPPVAIRTAGHPLPDTLTAGVATFGWAVDALDAAIEVERLDDGDGRVAVRHTGRDPVLGARAANAVAAALGGRIVERAAPPGEPAGPGRGLLILVGAAGGLALGLLAAFVRRSV